MNMKAEIIAVGSELLTPDRVDTDSLFLTEELNKIGIEVVRKTVVGDNREFLRDAFRDALERVPLVISTGGLGPTQDDLTREAVSDVLGRKLRLRDDLVEHIRARFRSFGREMTENNLQQAMVPEGAEPLANSRGTAPGIWIEDSGRMLALLPGPPRELMPMFKEHVLPRLARRVSGARLSTVSFASQVSANLSWTNASPPSTSAIPKWTPPYSPPSPAKSTFTSARGPATNRRRSKPSMRSFADSSSPSPIASFPRMALRSRKWSPNSSLSTTPPSPPPKAAPGACSRSA